MRDYYFDGYYDWLEFSDQSVREAAEAAYLPDTKTFADKPALLDIGCGAGTFARTMMARGWSVTGVEPFCPIEISDFPVHRKFLTEIETLTGNFEAVTAWAVLEHVTDPMAYFSKISAALKPSGTFVFLVTNFGSLSSKRLFQEDVPRHCHFFTKATVEHYLDKVGLDLVSARFDNDIYGMGCRGVVNYAFCRWILRRPYEWRDYPKAYPDFLEQHGFDRNILSAIRFCLAHPVTAVDRLCEPFFARWQKFSDSYGIVTYVARKRTAESH